MTPSSVSASAPRSGEGEGVKPHLLIAATGSVATIKLPLILTALSQLPVAIRVILTPSAASFLAGQSDEQPTVASLSSIPNVEAVYQDADEWDPPWTRGAKILHVELRRWSDLMVVAPMSANSLAKMVNGYSDGLVASVLRAWDTTGEIDGVRDEVYAKPRAGEAAPARRTKTIMVAVAMNTAMFLQPVTGKHMAVLRGEWNIANGGWVEVLEPTVKTLACMDRGMGAMMEWRAIVDRITAHFGLNTTTDAITT